VKRSDPWSRRSRSASSCPGTQRHSRCCRGSSPTRLCGRSGLVQPAAHWPPAPAPRSVTVGDPCRGAAGCCRCRAGAASAARCGAASGSALGRRPGGTRRCTASRTRGPSGSRRGDPGGTPRRRRGGSDQLAPAGLGVGARPTAGGLEIDRIALCWPGSAAVDDLDMRPADGRPDRRWRGPRRAKLAGS
jgi:hypothetical protein